MNGPVLVTGATGFIGRRLVARLRAGTRLVRALVLPGEPVPASWDDGVEVARGDIADPRAVAAAAQGVRGAIHLAALVAEWGAEAEFERVTVGGTRNVLAALPAGARLVLASSVVVYGDALQRDECDEAHPLGRPLGPYGRSKQAQERLAVAAMAERPVVIVRPGNVYGAGSGPWVRELVARLRGGGPCLVGGGGGNAGLCDVENLCDLLYLANESPTAVGRAYNANDGSDITWRRYVTDVALLAGAPPPRNIPAPLALVATRAAEAFHQLLRRPGRPLLTREAHNLVAADHRVPITRARRELGFAPRRGYDETMREIAESLRTEAPAGPDAK